MLCLGAALLTGCQGAKNKILPKKNAGIIYDTSLYKPASDNEETRNSVFASHFRQLHERYHLTLAEPVAVTKWSSEESTWQIFFASNRGGRTAANVVPASIDRVAEYFGNDALTTFRLGVAEVTIPGRQRGISPKSKSDRKKLLGVLPVSFGKKEDKRVARIDWIRELETNSFFQQLNSQISRSPGKDLLLFVHGFNVDYASCLIRGAQISLDLPFNGAVCCYSWPSQGGIAHYKNDEQISQQSTGPFTEFLMNLVDNIPQETKIQIVVHSMGNRVVMRALNRMPASQTGKKPFENVVLCAPDVGLSQYRALIEGVKQQSRRVTLYVCRGDTALAASKAIHSEQRAGDASPPVVIEGVETIDCSPVDLSFMGHSYYGGNISVLSDLFAIIKEGKQADQREWLTKMDNAQQQPFWRFTSQPTPIYWTWNFKKPILQRPAEKISGNSQKAGSASR